MQSSKHNVLNLRCFIRENVVKDFSHQAETSGIKSVLENLHSHQTLHHCSALLSVLICLSLAPPLAEEWRHYGALMQE